MAIEKNIMDRGHPEQKPYHFRCIFPTGHEGYLFVLSPEHREQELLDCLQHRKMPPFAVVTAAGRGMPDETVMVDLQRHYGFDPAKVPAISLCDLYQSH
jgi:hypothetical protein